MGTKIIASHRRRAALPKLYRRGDDLPGRGGNRAFIPVEGGKDRYSTASVLLSPTHECPAAACGGVLAHLRAIREQAHAIGQILQGGNFFGEKPAAFLEHATPRLLRKRRAFSRA